jgi:hypothetical protein
MGRIRVGASILPSESFRSAQLAVCSVAERRGFRMPAGAPGHCLGLGDFYFTWPQTGALVRSVAKRLLLRAPACAPPIGAGFHLLHQGCFLKNDRFSHRRFGLLEEWSNGMAGTWQYQISQRLITGAPSTVSAQDRHTVNSPRGGARRSGIALGCSGAVSRARCRNNGARAVPARSRSDSVRSAGLSSGLWNVNGLRPETGRAPTYPVHLGNTPPGCAPHHRGASNPIP